MGPQCRFVRAAVFWERKLLLIPKGHPFWDRKFLRKGYLFWYRNEQLDG